MENYIRFDWAMKRLLRNKANYAVLEGLLTTLLEEKVTIHKLLESESNQEDEFDKYNRVDMLAENSKGELVLIEVQNNNEYAYFQRMLFGASKLVTEYINRGEGYEKVRKVYSVNIVYFSLGHGKDFVYHGKTEFVGIHNGDVLELSPFQKQTFKVDKVSQLYPEYYILKVNDFNRVAKTPLEEWIYYLNTGNVPENATAPGLDTVKEQLKLDRMSREELRAYYKHLDNIVILRDNIMTERAEGRAEGRAEEKTAIARNLKALGLTTAQIAQATGLTEDEIRRIEQTI
ncbi:Rpn family recombination-promoting nuclease/putative transposase [Phocaeicola plebeius]|uniref:Rpn family recombination-promoting nuclease/putative transposase n=1 Tax=Phocaeicola plebeius TaxID=310297 RepID=UPI003AB5AA5E